jgi:hypothetical protein
MKGTMVTAVAALVALALTGCVRVDTTPQDGTAPPRTSSTAVPSDSTGSSTSGSSTPSSPGASSTSKPRLPVVDLTPETGQTYLAAFPASGMMSPPKVLGPWIEQWHLDGTKLTYREIICTGTAVRTATGTLEDGPDGKAVRWIDNGEGKADDPWVGNAETETTSLKITDSDVRAPLHEKAVSDTDGQTRAFVRHCKDAGEEVADFLGVGSK